MMGHLLVTSGPDQGQVFPLDEEQTFQIGRGQACQIRLRDPSVSRVHSQVQVTNHEVWLSDCGSHNGTRVNGQRITRHQLQAGDAIQVGTTSFRFQWEASSEEPTVLLNSSSFPTASEAPSSSAEPSARYLRTSTDRGVLVLTITLPHILEAALEEALTRELVAAVQYRRPKKVVLDLKRVKYIAGSDTGFQPLFILRRKVQEMGGQLVLCGLSEPVAELFHITGLLQPEGSGPALFEACRNVAEAIAQLTQVPAER